MTPEPGGDMTSEPQTAAGRALLAAFASDPCDCNAHRHDPPGAITAIEREAATRARSGLDAGLREAVRIVEALPGFVKTMTVDGDEVWSGSLSSTAAPGTIAHLADWLQRGPIISALTSSGEAAPTTATCLTCGALVIDALAGSCHECGAEDRHIGTQWLRMPKEQRPLSGETAPVEPHDLHPGVPCRVPGCPGPSRREAAPVDGLRAALIQTADRAHRVGCRPLDGLRAEFFNTDWRVCRNDECVAIRAALARQGDDDD